MDRAPLSILPLLAFLLVPAGCGGGGSGRDVTPDSFTLADVENASVGLHFASMTVTGVNVPVKVRVCCEDAGPEFSLDGGKTWRTKPADAGNGDVVMIRLHASPLPGGVVSATLYVGGTSAALDAEGTVSDEFRVTTRHDTKPPQVFIDFPPMRAATSTPVGGTLKVRGRAMDDVTVQAVTVNGLPAEFDPETGEWSADYVLEDGLQTITATVEDMTGSVHSASVQLERVNLGTLLGSGYRLGEGETVGQINGILANGLPDTPLLLATRHGLMKLDPATADRVRVEVPGVGGEITAIARMDEGRLLLGNDDPQGETGIAIYDVASGSAEFMRPVPGFEGNAGYPARGMAYHPKGLLDTDWILFFNSNFDLIQQRLDGVLFKTAGRETFRQGNPLARDIDYDPVTGKSYIGTGESIYAETTGADSSMHIQLPPEHFVMHIAIDPVTGEAFSPSLDDGRILKFDLPAQTFETALEDSSRDCSSTLGPPLLLSTIFEPMWDVDFTRRIAYEVVLMSQPGALACTAWDPGHYIFAIDLRTGYRVLVAKVPFSGRSFFRK